MSRSPVPNLLPASILRDITVEIEPHALLRPRIFARSSSVKASESAGNMLSQAGNAIKNGGISHAEENNLPRKNVEDVPSGQDRYLADDRSGYEAGLAKGYQEGLQQGHEAGRQAGFEQGIEQGRQQGISQGRDSAEQEVKDQARAHHDAMDARAARLDQLLSLLPSAVAERIEAAEDDMVALCHMIFCRFLGENALTRTGIVAMVRQAVRECCGESGKRGALQGLLAVQLHPQDLETIKGDSALADWLTQHGAETVQWLGNEQIEMGGCIVRSTQGTLDARLEIQLAELGETLLQGRSQSGHERPTPEMP